MRAEPSDYSTRFFVDTDDQEYYFFRQMKDNMWNRSREYIWCSKFVSHSDVCLDAACGTWQPFRFWLAENCAKTHACDMNGKAANFSVCASDVANMFVEPEPLSLDTFSKTNTVIANLAKLPYEDDMFDKVFCISVLEHTKKDQGIEVVNNAMREFERVVKPGGLVIMTMDCPPFVFQDLLDCVAVTDLKFVGSISSSKHDNMVQKGNRFVLRTVLTK